MLKNEDTFDWQDVRLHLRTRSGAEFDAWVPTVAVGQTVRIDCRAFLNPEGIRFNPNKDPEEEIRITAQTPRGDAVVRGRVLRQD